MSEWISVEDRLPEEKCMVLCYGFSGEKEDNPEHKDMDLGICEHGNLTMFGLSFGTVTHWVPIPAPPRSKDDE